MNIKKALLVTLSTGLIATTLLQTNYVKAEEGDIPNGSDNTKHELPQSAESDVKIKFSAPKGPVGPLDPDNLENPLEVGEDEGNETGYQGLLSLNYVSNIFFENEELDVERKFYESITDTPNIQVSDNRGFGYGWNVTAEANSFKNGEEDSLPGAIIHLNKGVAETPGTSQKPVVPQEIKLMTGDGPSDLIVDSVGRLEEGPQGLGEWIIKWISDEDAETERNNNVILEIPAGAATEGNHTAKINWTLSDGPYSRNSQED